MRRVLAITALLTLLSLSLAAEEARLLRFPDLHTDQVTFVYAGDLYVAPRDGGQALRLTSHDGLELFPKFSPDGSSIAFTGQYDGDQSVYVVPTTGGEPKRLTYHPGIQNTSERFGPENIVMDWHPDGRRVLFRSRKEAQDWWDGRTYLVSVDGGLPEPLPMASAGFTSLSPDAGKVAYCPRYRDFRTWKRYKGGMAQDVWIFDLQSYESQQITDWVGTDNMPMWFEDRIYFNSDRTGTLNLYCYDLTSGQTRRVTEFTEYDVRWPSLGPDGIAFENAGYVYVMDLPSETVHKLEIHLATDRHAVRPEYLCVEDRVLEYDIAPSGKRAVLRARGDLFTVPTGKGTTRHLTVGPEANDMHPRWSPDGKWIAYKSDATGEEEFYLVAADLSDTIQLTRGTDCHRFAPRWSPDSKKLAFADSKLRLYYIDIATKQLVLVDQADRSQPRDFRWSPDSRYLAFSKNLPNRISAIFVYDLTGKSLHQVTPGFTNDYSPVFDPGGKYLYFMSERNFNPILSNYEFSFVNNAIDNLFLIVLDATDKSPFAPKDDDAAEDDEDESDDDAEDDDKRDRKPGKRAKDKPAADVTIDFDGIFERQVAFDLPAGNYNGLAAIDGAVFYMSNPIRGLRGNVTQDKRTLHKYSLDKEKDYVFAEGITGYRLTPDGDRMMVRKDRKYHVIKTHGREADFKDSEIDLSNMIMKVDRPAEYPQMYGHVWRRLRDLFYDADMHGVDWPKMHDRYAVLLPYVANRYDLTYVLGEMVGELCCSHTYIGGGDKPDIPSSKIGLLGVDFSIDRANNRIRIDRILRGENWDARLRSPLREPGVDVNEGDYLLAINGHEITADLNPYSLTEQTVDKQITITVNDKPELKGAREVTVTPIGTEEALRYYNWVEKRRLYVDSISGGQIGYIHIPDMGGFGLVRFAKMFYNQFRRPGLIIDVRYNGGGFVSGLMLERLRREVVAMWAGRHGEPGRSPGGGIHAHMVTLLNEFSCSDGDYFPWFFREYKLGPLMGMRSWGGVIGIEGMDPLVDGGYYTVPEGGIFNLSGDWVMENEGVYPDIEIDNLPDRAARGYDDQLDRAIEYIQGKLAQDPKTLPTLNGPPTPR